MESPAELRERYAREREKRLAVSWADLDDLAGTLDGYLDDPHQQVAPREPVFDGVEVLVVGAGLGGLLAAASLRQAGIEDIRVVDIAGGVGGVWYWNRYPGAMCDVESLIYLPFLEELGYVPADRYVKAAEIRGYLEAVATTFRVTEDALFHTKVTGIEWHADRWMVSTDRGDRFTARFVVLANGPLSMPKVPAIPGIDSMTCHSFHTSRWDYDYTGGGPEEAMAGLRDKVVGIVGTGATGLQVVPPLAESAKQVYVFQRTPSTVAPRDNAPIDAEEVSGWKPGWQWERIVNFTDVLNGRPVDADLVQDAWTDLYADLMFRADYRDLDPEQAKAAREQADLDRMESIRARVAAVVDDPSTAETLKPYYDYFCKRPGFHDEYLAAFNRPNVTLVDTSAAGITGIDEDVVRVGDDGYRVDCLIFATGFEWDAPYTKKIGFDAVGRNAQRLSDKWKDGQRTLHGITTHGFPNLFVIPSTNQQAAFTENFCHALTEYARHVAYLIGETRARGAQVIEPTAEGEDAWVAEILARRRDDRAFLESCTPGRSNTSGRPQDRPLLNANWGGGAPAFFELLAQWRDKGQLSGLALRGPTDDGA